MSFDFSNSRVIVCGGSRGIGRAIALGFAAAGADVSICARSAAPLEATRKDLAAHGHRVHAAVCDLADGNAVKRYIADAGAALGGVDILVNNASGFGLSDDEAGWAAGHAIDVMAMVRASHAALPMLEASSKGAIINVSSIAAFRPSLRAPAYGAVKAAMIHYTVSQAAALARKRIRVNCIAPGSIEFPGGHWESVKLAGDPLYKQIVSKIPAGRMGTPDEVADVALFLASPYARWVTGQTIAVDGGQLLGA